MRKMKNKQSSRAMRRHFGGDMKQLMGMLQDVKLLMDSELMKHPDSQQIVLSKKDIEKQMKTCFSLLEKELSSISDDPEKPMHHPPAPSVHIRSRR